MRIGHSALRLAGSRSLSREPCARHGSTHHVCTNSHGDFPDLCAMDEGSPTLTVLLSESMWLPIISRQKGRERVVMALSAILFGTVASGKVFLAHEAKFLFPRQAPRTSYLSRQ